MKIAYVFEYYPVLSQRFLQREVDGLREQGIEVEIYSLFDLKWWQIFQCVPELWRVRRSWGAALRLFRQHWPTNAENFFSTIWATMYALGRVAEFRQRRPAVIHAVWATGPATAAAVLSHCAAIPFSFGAQAYDIHRHGGDAFLEPKLRAAAFVHTTTEANVRYLRQREPAANIVLARRGLERLPELSNQARAPGPIRILSVGRLVPKKGHALQIETLQRVTFPFAARIVGEGPLRAELQAAIDRAGLTSQVTLCGAQPEPDYRWADIFWHTGVVDAQGDRDGLPNVIPEAFAHGLPVISSDAGGAAEARAALVVPAGDIAALTDAVARLANDDSLRRELGEAGRRWVTENFLISRNTEILGGAFREAARQ